MDMDLIATAREGALGFFAIDDNLKRIEEAYPHDRIQVVGATKEVLESIFKKIIDTMPAPSPAPGGAPRRAGGKPNLGDLVKSAWAAFGEDPDAHIHGTIPNRQPKALVTQLTTITQTIGELRNTRGTGHGQANEIEPADLITTQLIVNAGLTVAIYFMQRFFQWAETQGENTSKEVQRAISDKRITERVPQVLGDSRSIQELRGARCVPKSAFSDTSSELTKTWRGECGNRYMQLLG